MNKLKSIRYLKLIVLEKIASFNLKKVKDGDYFVSSYVPYQSQFATPELASNILDNKIKGEADPNWSLFGFKTKQEYSFWSLRICGICCFKMILELYNLLNKSIAELTKEGLDLGGYDLKNDKGWFYKPLLKQAKLHGLKGYIVGYFGINSICDLILKKKFFIASVNPCIIRFDKNITNEEPGGHLVLIIGFKLKNGKCEGFYINNPSGKTDETRARAFISIEIFKKAYGNKGIGIWK